MSKFTLEEINEAVEHYFSGKESAKDMAKSLGINQSTFTEWIRHYEHKVLVQRLHLCERYIDS